MREPRSILLSIGFLHRRDLFKAAQQELAKHNLRPLDLLHDGPSPYGTSPLAAATELMAKADGYLTVIDTKHVMRPDKSHAENLRLEFDKAVESGLPIGLLVVGRRPSAPKYVSQRLADILDQFKSFHARNSKDLRSLEAIFVDPDDYQIGVRQLLGFLRARAEHFDAPDDTVIPTTIPDQSPAPVRVEERNGKIARISDRGSPLLTAERDFNDWREPVLDHIGEMLAGDFRQGTNHGRARDRLVALAKLLSASIPEIKERQFRVGHEVERLAGLISAYRSGGDDMPALSADVLEDLDRLRIALAMGTSKLKRWADFRREASEDPRRDGDASPVVVSQALDEMAVEMEQRPTYFDPELPETFRFLAEAARDPRGATRTVVYGGVRSAENLISFLGRRALGIGTSAIGAVEEHISKAIAAALIACLSGAALQISGTLPTAWEWLRPLIDALAKERRG